MTLIKARLSLKLNKSAIVWAANAVVEIVKSEEATLEYKEQFAAMVGAIMADFTQNSLVDSSIDEEKRDKIISLK